MCVLGIWWSHRWTWHFERGFLQRQHPDHATTKGQPDCECQAPCCFCLWLILMYQSQQMITIFFFFCSVHSCGHQKTRQMRERPEMGKTNGIALLSTYTLILNTDSLYTSPSTPSAPPTSVWQAAWIAPDQLVYPSQFTVRWQGNFQLADSVTLWKHVVLISESMLLLFLSALCVCM